MSIKITKYEAACNLGGCIEEIYQNALLGDFECFEENSACLTGKPARLGVISGDLPRISEQDYDLRCNRLLLKVCGLLENEINELIKKYGAENIAVVAATTNTGVEEFETSNNPKHAQIGNPAGFLKKHFNLKNFHASVSTACSSGIKAFSAACEILENNVAQAVIVAGVDSIAKVAVYGFDSLEVLSPKPSIPFSKNREGINIGEAAAIFLLEKDVSKGIEISGIGETTDVYHSTTPDPKAVEAVRAIKTALNKSKIDPQEVDYINLHGTGSISNDLMEANAVYQVFEDKVYASSTKPLTGHCLGAAASLETALCCKLLEENNTKVYPHIFDGVYDENLPKIRLAQKNCEVKQIKTCLSLSFGFGGTNAAIILRRCDE